MQVLGKLRRRLLNLLTSKCKPTRLHPELLVNMTENEDLPYLLWHLKRGWVTWASRQLLLSWREMGKTLRCPPQRWIPHNFDVPFAWTILNQAKTYASCLATTAFIRVV